MKAQTFLTIVSQLLVITLVAPLGAYAIELESSASGAVLATSSASTTESFTASMLLSSTTTPEDSMTEETECEPYFTSLIKFGIDNDATDVMRLQRFLNEYMKADLPVTGLYNEASLDALKKFQIKHKDIIMQPWVDAGQWPSADIPSGVVYKTTEYAINVVLCPNTLLSPPLIF